MNTTEEEVDTQLEEWKEILNPLAILVLAYSMVIMFGGAFVFVFLRNVSPIKNRSWIFMALSWLGLFGVLMQVFSNFYPVGDCFVQFILWKSVLPGPILVYSVRCLGLYFVYTYYEKLTKLRDDSSSSSSHSRNTDAEDDEADIAMVKKDEDNEEGEKKNEDSKKNHAAYMEKVKKKLDNKQEKIQAFKKKASSRFVFIIYMIVHAVVHWGTLIANLIYIFANGYELEAGCKNSIVQAVSIIQAVVFFVSMIVFTWKLWKVHDAYLVKLEMKIVGVAAVVLGLPSFALTLGGSGGPTALLGYLFMLSCYAVMVTGTFGVPAVVALLNFLKDKKIIKATNSGGFINRGDSSKGATNSGTESRREGFAEVEVPAENKLFSERKDINALLFDRLGYKTVDDYIIHVQSDQYGAALQFLQQVTKYEMMPSNSRPGTAYMIYHKFLKDNAYLYLRYISDNERDNIEEAVKKLEALKEDEEINEKDFEKLFTNSRAETERFLLDELFHGYFHSDFYKQYLKAKSLASFA